MRARSTAVMVLPALIMWILLFTAPPQDMSSPHVPRIITYDSDALSWPGVTLRTETGTATSGECSFHDSSSGEPSPGSTDTVTVIDTVALEPSTCTRTVATAAYPADAIPDSMRELIDPQVAQMIAERTLFPIARTIVPALTTTWSGSVAVTVRDPLNLTITQTVAGLTWTSTDGSVTSWEPYFSDSWATWSGWSRTQGRYDVSGSTDQYAYVDTSGYYKNDLFCPGLRNTTYSNHWITYFQGNADGGWTWERSVSYSGGCSWMLHDTVTLISP